MDVLEATENEKGTPMSRTKKRSAHLAGGVVLASLGLALPLSLAVVPAQAGELCDITGICGTVVNDSSSNGNILAGEGWDDAAGRPTGRTVTLEPGESSGGGVLHDTDGFYVPSGCQQGSYSRNGWIGGSYGPTWVKITDNQQTSVTVRC